MIRGNTVGSLALRANWNQEDPRMADYIIGKETVHEAMAAAQQHSANLENPHGVTLQQLGAAAEDHSHTAAEVGAVTEAQVLEIVQNQLGVIEHGTY